MTTAEAMGPVRLPCVGGLVRLTGPARITTALDRLLRTLRIPLEDLPVLDVTVSPDAQRAEGVAAARLLWSIALPAGAPVARLLGQIVGTLTTLQTRLLYVHAGVVGLEGRGIVLVGESGAGKTSTVGALLRRGASYLSDEVALLDPEAGVVIPFAIPMAVKPWTRKAAGGLPLGWTVLREDGVEFRLPHRLEPAPIVADTFVLLSHEQPGSRLASFSQAGMLLALARHASSFQQQHRVSEAFAGFSKVLRNARCMVLNTLRPAAHPNLFETLGRRIPEVRPGPT